ncbi:MAG: hypothetical protein AB8F74_22280 [Saprospiraceae bacterium]
MQKRLSLLILALFIFQFASAQNGTPSAAGAEGLAMGNTGTAHTGIYSLFSNPAGLSELEKTSVAVFGEQRFLIADLTILNVGFAMPTKSGNFGLQIQQFGIDNYTEQKFGLAYARSLSEKFALGAKIDVLNTRIPEYGSQLVLTFELGIQSNLSEKLSVAAHTYSPITVSVGEDYDLPSILNLALAYKSSEKLWMTLEAEKDIDHPVAIKAGIAYAATDNFVLRLGGATGPTLFSFGLGYTKKNITIDVASMYHQDLGMMPGLSGVFGFGG